MEDGENAKIYHVVKIMPCPFLQVSLKNVEYHASPLISKTAQKTCICLFNSLYGTQQNFIKLEQIYKVFSDFKCNLQQYSLFSKVLVCTQNSKDIVEPEFLVSS